MNRLKELRKQARLSVAELSRIAGVSASSLSKYENNKRAPSAEALRRLANALGTTVENILIVENPDGGAGPLPDGSITKLADESMTQAAQRPSSHDEHRRTAPPAHRDTPAQYIPDNQPAPPATVREARDAVPEASRGFAMHLQIPYDELTEEGQIELYKLYNLLKLKYGRDRNGGV